MMIIGLEVWLLVYFFLNYKYIINKKDFHYYFILFNHHIFFIVLTYIYIEVLTNTIYCFS